MNKVKTFSAVAVAALSLVLTSCQIAPVNAQTTITSTAGAGSKTISALVLVDGSCQIAPDAESFPSNTSYYYVDDVDFSSPTITPNPNGAKVRMYLDGYLANPNALTSCQAVWDEFNTQVEAAIPVGFTFNMETIQSDDWDDAYMETPPDATISAWKGYVYQVSYSWKSTAEYISKTTNLIGESYSISDLQELDDAGTPWATLVENDDDTYTWSEAYLVNFWSVYDIADRLMSSEYFNRDAIGVDYRVTTDSGFSISMQQYTIGESDSVTVKIDNDNGLNDDLSMKFISATGVLHEESNNTLAIVLGSVAALLVVAGVTTAVILKKKKKAAAPAGDKTK